MLRNQNGEHGLEDAAATTTGETAPFDVHEIVLRHRRDPSHLLAILHEVMAALGCVPPAVISELGALLGLPRAHVEGVVGFYAFFSSEPRGGFRVLFSDNVTDEMAGSVELRTRMLEAFR